MNPVIETPTTSPFGHKWLYTVGKRSIISPRRMTDAQVRAMLPSEPLESDLRVKFVTDPDARFEECNGESRPLTRDEYKKNEYWGCPNGHHGKSYTRPKNSGIGYCGTCDAKFKPVPYAEYLRYYGNPERHVYAQVDVEQRCGECGTWKYVAGLGHVDCMDDNPEVALIDNGTSYTPEQIAALPEDNYLRECALECLSEARRA